MIRENDCQQCGDPLRPDDDLLCKSCDHLLMAAAELRSVNLAIKIIQRYFTPSQQEQIVRAVWWNREGRG